MTGSNDRPLLLDTHIFAWWLLDSPRLTKTTRDAIAGATGPVLVSTASLWEMVGQYGRGKWPEVASIVGDLPGVLAVEAMTAVPISVLHARAAGLLDWAHRDPFDRMLAAQARAEGAILVTADRVFAQLPLTLLWN